MDPDDAIAQAETILSGAQRARQLERFWLSYGSIMEQIRERLRQSGVTPSWPNLDYHARLGLLRDLYPDLSSEAIERLHVYLIYRLRTDPAA
ncbi:MAG: hypothetical protein U0556_03990 [Dehalococcoidia bacterium]